MKLNKAEGKYGITDKEALAVVLACRHFHHYLWGTFFEIQTDHQPLTTIFRKPTKSPRVTRWLLEMREYHFKIKYLKGKDNVVADQLSRPVNMLQYALTDTWLGLSKGEFIEAQRQDPTWGELFNYLEGGSLPKRKTAQSNLARFELFENFLY